LRATQPPMEDFDDQPRSLWSRLKERVGWGEYDDEEEYELADPSDPRRTTLRVHQTRINHVSVWLTIQSFENAQQAADGLKLGHQQVVNLEKASPEITTRVVDFLSGVIYALNGFVEKVGEKVYLFTPANYCIEVENGESGRRVQSPFHEN
jgi:cell division inhibitor SepF